MNKRIISAILSIVICLSLCISANLSVFAVDLPYDDFNTYRPLKDECMKAMGLSSAMYDQLVSDLHKAMRNHSDSCDISSYSIDVSQENMQLIGKICSDFCDIFYSDFTYSFSRPVGGSCFSAVNFSYSYTKEESAAMKKEIDAVVDSIIDDIKNSSLSAAEKALLVHDRLIALCEYDEENFLIDPTSLPIDDFTIYGALVNRSAVCEGYSRAYTYILSKLMIDSFSVTSDQIMHMWNIVVIGGKEYHVDLSYDDPMTDIFGNVKHNYFLISTEKLLQNDSEREGCYSVPSSTTFDNYYWRNTDTQVCFLNGELYYLDKSTYEIIAVGSGETVYTVPESVWNAGPGRTWNGNYSRLASDENYLYYSTSEAIYRLDPTAWTAEECYVPAIAEHEELQVYGFTITDKCFYINMSTTPVIDLSTKDDYGIVYPYLHEHDWVEVELIPATVTTEGKASYKCSVCGKEKTEIIPVISISVGDINLDGKINAVDANIMKIFVLEGVENDSEFRARADINGDGKINAVDSNLLKSIILGQ